MKKINALLGVLFLCIFKTVSAQENIQFTDTTDNIYEEAIYFLQHQQIIKGYEDKTFRPNNKVNRAEFLKILISSNYQSELDRVGYKEQCFNDIENISDWYVPYACLAKKHGIIKGYDGNLLKPAKNINFAEAAKIISNVYSKDTKEDDQIWYKNYVQYLLANKLVPPQLTQFEKELTRGEISEMITRAIKLKSGKLNDYLEFRKSKYNEQTLPTWESLNGKEGSAQTSKVVNLTHPGTLVQGSYISNYEQYTKTDYPAGENNNKLSTTETERLRNELLQQLNQKRTASQKNRFEENSTLETIAQNFAEHLVANAFYSHMDLWGNKPNDRVTNAGYTGFVAESMVWKSKSPEEAINWWQNSALHWKNIMRDDFSQSGIGIVSEPTGGYIMVLLTGQ